ncbi:MAG: hypothetical protein NTZ14_08370 [Hyphomicrobiales bacterium]|nr:hypothetical protein [Hyphomicrobiales bacterium]
MGRGGKRAGAGRKPNDLDFSLSIGRHCMGLARQEIIAYAEGKSQGDPDLIHTNNEISRAREAVRSDPACIDALENFQLSLDDKAMDYGLAEPDDRQISDVTQVGMLFREKAMSPGTRDRIIAQTQQVFAAGGVTLTPSRIRRCWTLANDEARREEEHNMRLAREASDQEPEE